MVRYNQYDFALCAAESWCDMGRFCNKYNFIEPKDQIKRLQDELSKTYDILMETEEEAQEQIAELESELEVKDNLLKIKNGLLGNSDDLSTDPIEVAQMLINATYERETNAMERAFYKCGDTETVQRYSINDLEQIAEHLLVYCKHNRESEEL